MRDLKLSVNKRKRIEFWETFEQIADKNSILYEYLSVVKNVPEKYDCELCYLFNLLSQEIIPNLSFKPTRKETSAIISIYWGSMPRNDECSCEVVDIIQSINEVTRKSLGNQ